jgi:hypothetical protein
MSNKLKHLQTLTNLRRPESRAAASRLADGILRPDRRRRARMTANDELRGATKVTPPPPKSAKLPSFADLRHFYRALRTSASK